MKIGDRVSVIDQNLKGTITSVKGSQVFFRDEHGFVHQYDVRQLLIVDPSIYDEVKTIQRKEKTKTPISKNKNLHRVLDLHFEQLVETPELFSAAERIAIQREKLVQTVEDCRKNKVRRLEIIHGIGDGVLQKMVHDYLEAQTHIEFEDHDFFFHSTGSVTVFFHK